MRRRRRKTKIGGQFVWRLVEMLESPAMRVLNQSEHRVLMRLETEMAHHGGTANGRLVVTHKQFQDFGVDREAIAPSIRCVVALKIVEVTKQGRGGNREYREASEFRLTYRETDNADPTNEWRAITSIEEARRLAVEARKAKSEDAVSRSRAAAVKQKNGSDAPHVSGRNLRPENGAASGRKVRPSSPGRNLRPTIYISGEDTEKLGCEARPLKGAVASSPTTIEREDIVQGRIAQRLGSRGWEVLQNLNDSDLQQITALERRGELDDQMLEMMRLHARKGAA